jgi:hypothetical protein
MKTFIGSLAMAAFVAVASLAHAAGNPDPVIGTWKLDTARSTSSIAMPKSEVRHYVAAGDGVTISWDRVSADGKTSHVETTYQYDGKDYPVTSSPDFDALSAKRIDERTVETTQKRNGKKVGTSRRTVSADGKTLTLNALFTDAAGQHVDTLMVYDRQ